MIRFTTRQPFTHSDGIAYLYQNVDGGAKKAMQSLGVTGHSYPIALKTLKRQFGNPNRVATAYLNDMLKLTVLMYPQMIGKHAVTAITN